MEVVFPAFLVYLCVIPMPLASSREFQIAVVVEISLELLGFQGVMGEDASVFVYGYESTVDLTVPVP